jgi:hypothetical protein
VIEGDNSPACTRSETRNMGMEQARRCSTAIVDVRDALTEALWPPPRSLSRMGRRGEDPTGQQRVSSISLSPPGC